ncbi:hypothetical protein QZH41_019993, partial [Actinostola sp. cb2023]
MWKKTSTIRVEFYEQNLALFTRRSVKLSVEDEKIFKFEIATPSIREGAVVAANNEETSKYMVATPSIREGAVPAANNEETTKGSYLHSINGNPFHGSSASLLIDVNHTMESEESYPLTIVFKSEPDEKEEKSLTLPVSDDFLGDYPSLSEKEMNEYIRLAKSWVQGLLDASTSDEGFNYVCTRENVDIYQGHDSHKKINLIRGKTKVKCSKEEMRAFMIAPTTESFRRLFHMIDVHFQDGLMLHQFPQGYKHPGVPFYSIKWAVVGVRSSPLWLRDVCWLEYGDILTDKNGEEFGFGVASSIERPECPKMEHYGLVRAELLCSGYIFRKMPNEPDYMEVTYVVQADPKGWLPTWAVNMFAWQQALNVARIRNNAEGIHQAKEKMTEHNRNGAAVQGVLIPYGQNHAIDIEVTDEWNSLLSFGFCTTSNDIGITIVIIINNNSMTIAIIISNNNNNSITNAITIIIISNNNSINIIIINNNNNSITIIIINNNNNSITIIISNNNNNNNSITIIIIINNNNNNNNNSSNKMMIVYTEGYKNVPPFSYCRFYVTGVPEGESWGTNTRYLADESPISGQ